MSVRSKVNNFRFIQSVLEGIGYKLAIVEGKHRAFTHARNDHLPILLPGEDRYVTPAHVEMVRAVLRISGVMRPEEYDRLHYQYEESARTLTARKVF